MFDCLKRGQNDIEICAVSLHSFSVSTDWNRLLSVIRPAERDRISHLSRREDRLLRIASHLLVSTAIGEKLGLRYQECPFERGNYGKPYLDAADAPFFNLSYSGDMAVCALAHHPVGIDVERCDPIEAESLRLLLGKPADARADEEEQREELRFFYSRWTMLESWLKAEGTGLHERYPLSSFVPRQDGRCFRVRALEEGLPPWVVESREMEWPAPGRYALAVCRRPEEPSASEVTLLNGDQLVKRFLMLV